MIKDIQSQNKKGGARGQSPLLLHASCAPCQEIRRPVATLTSCGSRINGDLWFWLFIQWSNNWTRKAKSQSEENRLTAYLQIDLCLAIIVTEAKFFYPNFRLYDFCFVLLFQFLCRLWKNREIGGGKNCFYSTPNNNSFQSGTLDCETRNLHQHTVSLSENSDPKKFFLAITSYVMQGKFPSNEWALKTQNV